jgi:hypothetical protein
MHLQYFQYACEVHQAKASAFAIVDMLFQKQAKESKEKS